MKIKVWSGLPVFCARTELVHLRQDAHDRVVDLGHRDAAGLDCGEQGRAHVAAAGHLLVETESTINLSKASSLGLKLWSGGDGVCTHPSLMLIECVAPQSLMTHPSKPARVLKSVLRVSLFPQE